MQIKKYEAPTMQEALDTIKRELGPEAIILQTKTNKKGFGLLNGTSVEVTAAISERSVQRRSFVENKLPNEKKEKLRNLPAQEQARVLEKSLQTTEVRAQAAANIANGTAARNDRRYVDIADEPGAPRAAVQSFGEVDSLKNELKQLKRMLEEIKVDQRKEESQAGAKDLSADLADPLRDAYEQLLLSGVERRFAFPLIKRVGFELGNDLSRNPDAVTDQVAIELIQSIETHDLLSALSPRAPDQGPHCLALIGPTGVGKTTTLAKLASLVKQKNHIQVGVINLDSFRVGATEQVETYCKILNIPYRNAQSYMELETSLDDFKELDLILIDTTGRSQKDHDAIKELSEWFAKCGDTLQTHLVLSSTTRETEIIETINRFSKLKPLSLLFTKLDESSLFGSIYNVHLKTKLPLTLFTTGQRVPEDIEGAMPERLAALILQI